MPRSSSSLTGALVALTAAALFATLGSLSRLAYDLGVEPLSFVAWRTGVAAIVVAALVALTSRGRSLAAGFDRQSVAALGVGIFAGFVVNLSIFAAFDRVTVALALLGFYTYPAMVASVAILSGREAATRSTLAALAVALAGMVLVVAGGFDPDAGLRADPLGFLLALAAAGAQTVYVTISRGYRQVPADRAMGLILAGGALGTIILAALGGGMEGIARPLGQPEVLPILLLAGTLGAAVPSVLFLVAIRLVGGTRAGILMLAEPVVGVALAAALLDEAIGPLQVAGGAAVLAGAAILQRGSGSARDRDRGRGSAARANDEVVVVPAPGGP